MTYWIGTDPDDLVQHNFGDYHAVYHRGSGKSHFLNPSAGMVLTVIGRHPIHVETIVERLRVSFPELDVFDERSSGQTSSPPTLTAFVTNLLLRLDELGLVQRKA